MSAEPSAFIGPILIGVLLNWCLLGTLIVQLYIFQNCQLKTRDRAWLRLLVYAVVSVDVVETALSTHYLWFYAVSSWGDPIVARAAPPWSGQVLSVLTGIVTLMIQSMYSWRIWTLTRSYLFRALVGFVIALSLTQFGASLAAPALVLSANVKRTSVKHFEAVVEVWLVGSFAADMLIAACMITLLSRARAQTIWDQSQSLYDRLIISTVQTGSITAIVAGVDLALYVHNPQSNIWITPSIILSLNSRIFRHDDQSRETTTIDLRTSGGRSSTLDVGTTPHLNLHF